MDARGRMFAATLCIGDHDNLLGSSLACPEDARQERESSIHLRATCQ